MKNTAQWVMTGISNNSAVMIEIFNYREMNKNMTAE